MFCIVILPGAKCRGSSSCVYCDVIPWASCKVQVYIEMLPGASYRGSSTYVYWDVTRGFWCMCLLKCYLGPHAGVPATVVSSPQLDPSQTGHREQYVLLESRGVQRVSKLLNLTVHKRP